MDIKESLRRKLQGTRYYTEGQPETSKQTERPTYEQAKLSGDITTMLNHKLGIYEAGDRQKELDTLLSNLDIVSVATEIKGIEGKIEKAVNDHRAKLEKDKAELKDRYEDELQQFFKRGGSRGSIHADIIIDNYKSELRGLEESGEKPSKEMQALLDRKEILTIAKQHYVEQNAETIEQIRKAQVIKDIERSNLLDDID